MSLRFGMANLKGDKIRRQYLSNVLPPKLSPLTKDVPTPSEFLFGNNLNDRIGTIETSQKMLQTYSNSPYYRNSKNLQRFSKKSWKSKQFKTRGTAAAAAKPEVTTTTKNNGRGISNHNTTREAELHKVGTTTILTFQQKDYPNSKQRYSEL